MLNQLQFSGDKVLIPASELFCVVLQPAGCVVMAHCNEGEANDFKSTLDAHLHDFDILHVTESVEVMTAAELRQQQKRGRRMRVAAG